MQYLIRHKHEWTVIKPCFNEWVHGTGDLDCMLFALTNIFICSHITYVIIQFHLNLWCRYNSNCLSNPKT